MKSVTILAFKWQFNLQFDTVMVQNSFHSIYKVRFQVIELLLI